MSYANINILHKKVIGLRIGINVPNELLRQVKEVRPKVNVSQVCRDALQRLVDFAQRATAQAHRDEMAKQVRRLEDSATKLTIEPDWEGLAFVDARNWVRGISPKDWEFFLHQCDVLRRKGRNEIGMVGLWSEDHGAKGLGHHLSEYKDWIAHQNEADFDLGTDSNPLEEATQKYSRAWLAYVHEVRRLLERHRKKEYDRIMSERADALASRPAPELPTHLV